jgi:hypothetical protein
MKAQSNFESAVHSVDSDGDYLPDYVELEFGTDPYSADSDFDYLSDLDEMYLGTSPLEWDTDNDHIADGHELGTRDGSTSPFETDSDHDGLPDPWEDNDGDGLLNREEQLPIHDGIMFFTDPFHDPPEERPPTDPNDFDTDGDGLDDGFEVQANSTYNQPDAVNPAPPVDRQNSELDIANTNSYAYWFCRNTQNWDDATFADWRNGLKLAASYGLLPNQCTKIAWYHFSPFYIYEQVNPPQAFNAWRQDFFHSTTNQTLRSDWDRGTPYIWNWYDCDPTLNDTDGDFMDDDWDVYPLRYNTRNGTYTAINAMKRVGQTEVFVVPPYIDPWNHFGTNITTLELEKGDWVDINVSIGLQYCDPDNASHENWINSYWDPISVRFQFRPVDLGIDNLPHTGDDDDVLEVDNVAFLTRGFNNVDRDHLVTTMREVPFTNHMNQAVTMTFYYQWFRIRIPSRVPAGQVALVVETVCEDNFHYFPSDETYAY